MTAEFRFLRRCTTMDLPDFRSAMRLTLYGWATLGLLGMAINLLMIPLRLISYRGSV